MSNNEKHHTVSYRTYFYVLLGLLMLTGLSVAVTRVDLGGMPVFVALLLASLKSVLVLVYFMHLKFDNKLYAIMVGLVLAVFVIVVVITFLDYTYR
ncbi:MAG: cytochrome C oxidase subunit IV family protein [Bacteroidota bacterium]